MGGSPQYDVSTSVRTGDLVFVVKGGGIQSAVVDKVTGDHAELIPLHEKGRDIVRTSDLIQRHKYKREAIVPKTATKAKAKKRDDEDEDDDDDDTPTKSSDDDDDDDDDEDEAPKKKGKAKASDDDDDDDDDEDDEDDDKPVKKAKKASKSDDDDDDEDEDDDDEPKAKKKKAKASKKSDDDDDDEDDDEDEPKSKKKGKKKSGGSREPKRADPSKPLGREGTKRRALFDAMRKGGEWGDIIGMAIEIDSEDGKVSKEDKEAYKRIGTSAVKGFAKLLDKVGYDVKMDDEKVKVKLVK